ncbi:hypothetical protein ACP70R_000187 [Stipagrostis hirtigluma subsp. patula]
MEPLAVELHARAGAVEPRAMAGPWIWTLASRAGSRAPWRASWIRAWGATRHGRHGDGATLGDGERGAIGATADCPAGRLTCYLPDDGGHAGVRGAVRGCPIRVAVVALLPAARCGVEGPRAFVRVRP